jgi:hypothetical protein
LTTKISGQLEIDHQRGVVYFHADNEEAVRQYQTQTILRIKCPRPIPNDRQIDLVIGPNDKGFNEARFQGKEFVRGESKPKDGS